MFHNILCAFKKNCIIKSQALNIPCYTHFRDYQAVVVALQEGIIQYYSPTYIYIYVCAYSPTGNDTYNIRGPAQQVFSGTGLFTTICGILARIYACISNIFFLLRRLPRVVTRMTLKLLETRDRILHAAMVYIVTFSYHFERI